MKLTADGHDSVGLGHVGADHLETAAACHRVIHDRIGTETRYSFVAVDVHEIIYPFPDSSDGIKAQSLLYRLVGTRFVDFKCGFAIEPVIRTAQAEAFGRNHADVVGGERLAQEAGIKCFHRLVCHCLKAPVSFVVRRTGDRESLFDLLLFRNESDSDLVHNCRIVRQEFRV